MDFRCVQYFKRNLRYWTWENLHKVLGLCHNRFCLQIHYGYEIALEYVINFIIYALGGTT
jgi:hypothetical protein